MRRIIAEYLLFLLLTPCLALMAALPALADTSAGCNSGHESKILYVGMSTSLSGPVRSVGAAMKAGVEAYFDVVNQRGGVGGRQICLITLDDSYDPPTAAANVKKLAQDKKILAIIGAVGTPTAKVSLPIATAEKILFFGALTGSSLLRTTPPNPYVINFRASYGEEIETMISGLFAIGIKPDEIAVFAQNDAYGDAGYESTVKALTRHGDIRANQTLRANYTRSTMDVENAVITLIKSPVPPKAIIMVGAYAPSAKFIRLARKVFRQPLFLNLSFVNGAILKETLREEAEDIIVTQIVPPIISELEAVADYRHILKKFDAKLEPNDISLEGFLMAKLFVEGLRRAGPHPTREDIIKALLKVDNFDIGMGVPVNLDAENRQASHQVWPTIVRNGIFIPLDWSSLTVTLRP
jgi:ABC-type branched-subunit amino acid transport system substrate-binding protein